MSYIVLSDRVKETSFTQGTSNFSLEGAVQGFSSFGSAYSDGDNLFYAITDGTNYEVGSGVYVTGVENQITRSALRSSNSNNLVDFGIGLKEVFVTYPGTHSVYHASGYASEEAPVGSGIAFWLSSNVVGYDSTFIWDNTNHRIGINKIDPDYTIELGGYGPDAIIRASGFMVGDSGVFFPEANNGDSGYEGGRQLVHFEPNDVLDTDSKTVIDVSGQVNQYIYLKEQAKGFVLAGPPSGCTGSCDEAVPQFRPLSLEDIPNLSSLYELAGVSGILRNDLNSVSGIIISSGTQFIADLEAASGELSDRIMDVSGIIISSGTQFINDLEAASGQLDFDITIVSGMAVAASGEGISLEQSMEATSGIVIASGTQFIFDLEAASGELSDRIMDVSGIIISSGTKFTDDLEAASGQLDFDITIVSGMVVAASAEGISLEQSMQATSGIVIASGTQFILDLQAASGELDSRISSIDGISLNESMEATSGIVIASGTQFILDLEAASGELSDRIMDVSGIIISSGTQFISDLEAASGQLFFDIQGSSGVSNRLSIDLTGTTNTASIRNDDDAEPTHFRIINSAGVGSRLLLESSSGDLGNVWANVSLSDGAYRVYNYTYNYDANVSGVLSGTNQVILESGHAWRNILPYNLVGAHISGSFLNNGSPDGAEILSQFPTSGHILTLSSSDFTSSPSLPAPVQIFSLGVNGMTVNENNKVGFNLDPQAITSDLDIRGETIRIRNSGVVTSSSDNGYRGEIKWDSDYIYVCVANNTWKRASLTTW